MNSYKIRSLAGGDRSSLEDLYYAIYGETWPEKTKLAWTLDSPLSDAGVTVATEGNTIVAAQPYCDLPLHTPWGFDRVTLFVDVATHPDHRRSGLFKRVVNAASATAFERGASVIMTTPNAIAARGFETLPGWVRLCSLDCLVLPLGAGDAVTNGGLVSLGARMTLSAASLLFRKPLSVNLTVNSGDSIEANWAGGSEADQLWRCAAPGQAITVSRDRAFLQWRFGPEYQLFLGRNGQGPSGYAALRMMTRAGIKFGMVVDCITGPHGAMAVRSLRSAVGWLREHGAAAAIGYFVPHSEMWHRAREAGFIRLPRSCSPREYPVYASVRPRHPHAAALSDPSQWHMTLADSDLA